MADAPVFDIDPIAFHADPYPTLARMRARAPVCFVPQLGATLITRRDDVFVCEKNVAVFSSHQPGGLMNVLMGYNLMRKDGEAHAAERQVIARSLNPRVVRDTWRAQFERHAEVILEDLRPQGRGDLVTDWAMRLSGEALKLLTGLTNLTWRRMDACSQAMIDGIANYAGNPDIAARCHAATAELDVAIDAMTPAKRAEPDESLLSVMLEAGLPIDSIRANVKLAISGGQNEPREAIAGCIFALLTNPGQLALVRAGEASWMQVFEEYARWNAPIGMSPRRVAQPFTYTPQPWTARRVAPPEIDAPVDFTPESRVFLMFGSANRDEAHFADADRFDVRRDTAKAVSFGAGPHFCAGAWASRVLVAEIGVRLAFERLEGLRLVDPQAVRFAGWAFRGPQKVEAVWN
ncbi:MAG TPA: cytochrome P450 [Rhizobiaceae bacterium]|nr:cytochrome P450 [Rhizobiaceae bacterium]